MVAEPHSQLIGWPLGVPGCTSRRPISLAVSHSVPTCQSALTTPFFRSYAPRNCSHPLSRSAARALRQDESKSVSGRRIGHYTVLEQIGSGGMEVFSAVRSDGHFDQKVAVKLVRAAAASGKSLATWSKVSHPARLSTIGLEVATPDEVSRRHAECESQIKLLESSVC
jgi:hypothetical protein